MAVQLPNSAEQMVAHFANAAMETAKLNIPPDAKFAILFAEIFSWNLRFSDASIPVSGDPPMSADTLADYQ